MAGMLHKSWQDKRPGWTRRVRWYDRADGSVRLCFEDTPGEQNVIYPCADCAHEAYSLFRAGNEEGTA